MSDEQCVGCGATSRGVLVCHHCGVPVRSLIDAESQRRALDELHGQLAVPNPPPHLLDNAFLPDDPRVLIDAGLRLLPVLERGTGQAAAAGRMKAIIIKLRLLGEDPTLVEAARQLEAALATYHREDRKWGYVVATFLIVVVAGIGGVVKCAC
ncbi:MAG TPA: hypothetical protein VM869_25470 [Enhygromyxa sp.]|nr:hypothetical protein [Enhygromyxa sp.]